MSTCERCWQLGGSTAEGYAAELLKHHDSQHDLLARAEKAEASLAAAEAKLADERKHVAVLAAALEETRCTCEAVFVGGMPTALKCTRCRALTAHAARRAHDDQCESEFDSQAHAHTPCGCAARRQEEAR